MKYLLPKFTFYMGGDGRGTIRAMFPFIADQEQAIKKAKASNPHEFVNGGSMCQVCGLGKDAKIHSPGDEKPYTRTRRK